MRKTEFHRGYGYITGDGVLDDIVKGVTSALTEGTKALAKSAGDKIGSKLVEKVTTAKKKHIMLKDRNNDKRSNEQALKEIYGDSILGKGIRKIEL